MAALRLHITKVPPGEAPLGVREQWVGLSFPLTARNARPRSVATFGVLTGPRGFGSRLFALLAGRKLPSRGYVVESLAAIQALEAASPQAAAWWHTNAPHLLRRGRFFVFHEDVGHVGE